MAEENSIKKRPRIRKTAPTVRERAAAVQEKTNKPVKPKRFRQGFAKLSLSVKKLGSKFRIKLPNNLFGRILGKIGRVLGWILRPLVPHYFINSWREMRLVTWPSRKETWRLTMAVFIFALVFGSLVFVVDKALDDIFKKLILK